jgi:esterase/lipase superfamily enzyme
MSDVLRISLEHSDSAAAVGGVGRRRGRLRSRFFLFMQRPTQPFLVVSALATLALLCGCGPSLLYCPRTVKVPAPPIPQQHSSLVLFATDRYPESAEHLTFSANLNPAGDPMTYGAKCADPAGAKPDCEVPPVRLDKNGFLQRISAARSDVVLFVHGFNYTFDESLETTLRIVQRAKAPATPVAYGWPSQGKVGAYGLDNDMSEWTTGHLADFVRDLAAAVPAPYRLHIVAHSMGNRALLLALAGLDLTNARLGQLILIAPDVDTAIFKVLISRSGPFQRKTLYVSDHDLALRAAGFLRAGTIRAGDAAKQYLVMEDIDTIDMSLLSAGIFGHSMDEYSQIIFDDLSGVLKDDTAPKRNLTACSVRSVQRLNEAQGTSLPCTVYRLPSK